VTHFKFWAKVISLERLKFFNFVTDRLYHACGLGMVNYPQKGHDQVTSYKFWGSDYIFVMGKTKHFKFHVHIDVDEFERMHDRLLNKGMRSMSHDLFSFEQELSSS